jgi:hypothetical protein
VPNAAAAVAHGGVDRTVTALRAAAQQVPEPVGLPHPRELAAAGQLSRTDAERKRQTAYEAGLRRYTAHAAASARAHGLLDHVAEEPDRWVLVRPPEPGAEFRKLIETCPEHACATVLPAWRGSHLPEILRDQHDPSNTLLTGSDLHFVEQHHDRAPHLLAANRITAEVMRGIVARWPVDRPADPAGRA